MKRIAGVLILTFAASAAWAQVSPRTVTDVRNSLNQATAQSAVAPAKSSGSVAAAGSASGKAPVVVHTSNESLGATARKVAKPPIANATPPKPVAKKSKKEPAAPAPAATAAAQPPVPGNSSVAGKRDPFVSPIVSKVSGPIGCSGGKKCLVVDQIALKGIVKAPTGMIAVIENAGRKAYFMRENDPVYNGFVVKITPDSIVFRETVTDRIGRSSTRDVVKRVNAPAV